MFQSIDTSTIATRISPKTGLFQSETIEDTTHALETPEIAIPRARNAIVVRGMEVTDEEKRKLIAQLKETARLMERELQIWSSPQPSQKDKAA